MGSEPPNEALDEHLEHRSRNQTFQETHGGGEQVLEAASARLEEAEEEEGREKGDERRRPDGDDFFAQGVREFGVDDVAVERVYGEGARGRRRLFESSWGVSEGF